ncbi:MAG: hypothetical protein GY944_25310 [bacterium]|nr:hypothetical protein [bacterium]
MRVLRARLAPGMILETGAMDRDGRMLIGADTVLTERMLEVLDNSQIPILYVTDESWEAHKTGPELPPLDEAKVRALTRRFEHTDLTVPFARAVFEECMSIAREKTAQAEEDVGV